MKDSKGNSFALDLMHQVLTSVSSGDPSSEALGDNLVTDQNKQWDFSFTTGVTISLAVIYLAQCIRLQHMPIETRNKFTMTVWWSIWMNLVALEIRNIIMIALDLNKDSLNELSSYALNSVACFFFTNAIMLQAFEWDLLGSMIVFQGQREVKELGVVKD